MNTAPSSAAANASGWKWSAPSASEVPTSTGATAAGSVRTRAAITQMRIALTSPMALTLGPPGGAGEVRCALLAVGVAPLLRLLAAVEQQVRVVGQLLHAAQPVLGRVEARLQQSQGEGREREHLPAPGDRLLLQALERNDRVDQSHLQRFGGRVLPAEEPDLLGLLGPHEIGEQPGAEAAVEGADPRPHLTEARVLG